MREAEYQGISVEEAIKQHEDAEKEAEERAKKPKPTRVPNSEQAEPAVQFGEARKQGEEHGEWGSGDAGYKIPQTPGERLRSAWSIRFALLDSWADELTGVFFARCTGKTYRTRYESSLRVPNKRADFVVV